LAVAVAECCIMPTDPVVGADVDLSPWSALPLRALLFGEAQGRVVVSTTNAERVLAVARRHGVPAMVIGHVRSAEAGLRIRVGAQVAHSDLPSLADAYHQSIPRLMTRVASAVLDDDLLPAGA
jgi:phosphoribosylformylglycinamidine synthase